MKSLEYYLRLVEYSSIPLMTLMTLYILSGYGMITPLFNIIGFTYSTSHKIHTLPLIRYLTSILTAIHCYCGIIIMTNRRVRNPVLRNVIAYLALLYAALLTSLTTLAELILFLT